VPEEIREQGAPRAAVASARTFVERKAEAEREIIVAALERNGGHVTRTARELGLADHASLLKIMRRHRIARE
jgi:transcriptional regulator with GAF, ATPase, and Fis domain